MWIICLAFWIRIHLVMCVIETENVVYKCFSSGEEITLKCNCVALYWNGPTLNTVKSTEEEISQLEITDVYGNMKTWNLSIYTQGGKIADTLSTQLVKRLNLMGDNFDLHITNLSSSDEGLYICDSTVNCSLPHNRYLLYSKYKPSIKVNISKNFIVEGETTHLYCNTESNPKTTSISWYKEDKELVSTKNESSLSYMIINASRFDTGNYKCSVQKEIGNASSEISIKISYSPVVNVQNRKLSEDSMLREIQCIAKGEPDTYNFFPWEHRSQFDEHIRYLEATDKGILQLPEVNLSNSYQNTGIYICNVSNGIPDYHRNVFQQGRVYVEFEAPPVFSADSLRLQDSTKESEIEIKVNVYSSSQITCHNLTEIDSMPFTPVDINVATNPIQIKEKFHDAIITLNGTEIIFVLNGLNSRGSREFNVTVCNSYGQGSFVVVLKSFEKTGDSQRTTQPIVIIVTAVILTLLLVPLLLKCIFIVKNSIKNEVITAINIQTAERNVDESTHYSEIFEEDIMLTPPQETDRIVAENSNTTALSDEHSSASSNTDINASENLDDGYEKPYTTFVANNGGEDEHVYCKTKQNWTYENLTPFENGAFQHSVEFTEQGFSLDKTKTNVSANEGQESANMNYGENYSKETDDDFQRSNVYKQKKTKEYINLSLK